MNKRTAILLSVVLSASLLLPAAASAATTAPTVGQIQSSVSFRSLPSTSSTVYKYLKQGEQVVILEKVNTYWYKVQDSAGAIGYISSDDKYVEIVEAVSPTAGKATIAASVSFRTGPSTDSARIRYLAKGEQVTVTGQPNGYWYAVTAADGTKGYVSSDEKYITVTGSVTQPSGNASGGNTTSGSSSGGNASGGSASANATIVASVSFRTGPSTDNERIRYLSKGEQVTVTGQPSSNWYAVTAADGTKGYVSSDEKYITMTGSVTQPGGSASGGNASNGSSSGGSASANATIVASVSFRTGPSTDNERIRYLSKGEQVTVTGQPSSNWYAVTAADGTKGYVSSDEKYITVTGSIPQAGGNGSNGSPGSNNSGGTSSGSADNHAALVESVIAAGMKYWGTPYEYGSDRSTTTTFDCSDFVRTAFREGANLTLPADSRKQGDYVRNLGSVKTDWHQLKRGDLMFFMDSKGSSASAYKNVNKAEETITHVGIYLGDGQILHTYSTASGGVRTSVIADTHWEYRFLFGGSVL
ncbi:SH3 domain-containing protein [Paenibacillus lycopersici]|uniref:SH3 domain-containing protein n=1 Tax=Paenibacillus lycopersici TaxID=2704462 RepID=A0A6C0FY54_9BACL|nr:SH3 domain-containing protein [Paenibacillus lycopersici]QHT59899.1 SH3 domain-containing protein [Paenibacillus lycopersici]